MSLTKPKTVIKNINSKLGGKLIPWHALTLGVPMVLSVGIFGLVVHLQPVSTHVPINSQRTANRQSVTRHFSAPPKITQPAPPTPQVAALPPSIPKPAPAKTVTPAASPKPEPVVTPSPSSSVSGLTPTTPAASPASSPAPSPKTTTGYTSTNWSGYLAANGSFTGISGSWTATLATGNGSTTSADSTWIGIGGVTSGDLIQTGTQNIISASGQVSTSAFYELLPDVSQPVVGVTVSPGDIMTASITGGSGGQWTITITDNSDGQSATINVTYASSLSSAEWVEEDPSFSFRRQIPFDNFHQAAFTAGSAVDNGVSANIAASSAQPVTMVNNSGQVVALPSAIGSDGASFTVAP